MSRLTLRQLEYLVAVGETGSIARAADRLNVSSPSISSAITQLEEELAISLFVRQHAQGLSLTKGGEKVLEQARRVLAGAREISNVAADVSGIARGPLAVGCLLTFAQLVLPRLRRGFESEAAGQWGPGADPPLRRYRPSDQPAHAPARP